MFCFFSKIDREKVFANVLDKKKKPLKAIKTTVYENQKNWDFSKGVSPSFWSKI